MILQSAADSIKVASARDLAAGTQLSAAFPGPALDVAPGQFRHVPGR